MATLKRWRVRRGGFGFKTPDGKVLMSTPDVPAIFEATDEEVAGQEFKLDLIDEYEAPEPKPRTKRGAKLDRMVHAAPENTVI